jgi:DNA-binding NarL/FixJ family response regulator
VSLENTGGLARVVVTDVAGLRAGASGFLLTDVPPPDLLSAIRATKASTR